MILIIYIFLLSYFIIGGISFQFINRKKDRQTAQENWIKFITYFIIINIVFLSIILNPVVFQALSIFILLMGLSEIISVFRKSDYNKPVFGGLSLFVFLILGTGFLLFSRVDRNLILFTFLVISIFDAFSQICGQLGGRRKIFPAISPKKTIEGLIGGALIAIASSFLMQELSETQLLHTLIFVSGIIFFAFLGDSAASLYKRKFLVKDFSSLIPGHGGFLDRFDSLIAGGAFVAFVEIFTT